MADFHYTVAPSSLARFFSHIQGAGVPNKVTHKYLEKSGFKSSNDRAIISILKFIEFIDSSGVPTDQWKQYRDKTKARGVLAVAVQEAYKDLFSTFPDAHRKDNEALRNYFSAHTKVGDRALKAIVETFRALCGLSDFELAAEPPTETELAKQLEGTITNRVETGKGLTLNVNIQLQLPATEDASIYEKFFAALKKHLMSD